MSPEDIAEALRICEALLWRWEGMRLRPYLCTANVPTIGLGTTRYPDGRAVTLADPAITKEHALVIARDQLRREYLRGVRALVPNLTDSAKVGACASLVYNIGVGAFRASTLRRKINAEAWDEVPDRWRRWNRSGGKVTRGLVLRREAELRAGGWV